MQIDYNYCEEQVKKFMELSHALHGVFPYVKRFYNSGDEKQGRHVVDFLKFWGEEMLRMAEEGITIRKKDPSRKLPYNVYFPATDGDLTLFGDVTVNDFARLNGNRPLRIHKDLIELLKYINDTYGKVKVIAGKHPFILYNDIPKAQYYHMMGNAADIRIEGYTSTDAFLDIFLKQYKDKRGKLSVFAMSDFIHVAIKMGAPKWNTILLMTGLRGHNPHCKIKGSYQLSF